MSFVIIDNYDSFTYNLVHYLTLGAGHEPLVVSNDDFGALDSLRAQALAGSIEGIVISPGPGHPSVRRDFGISAWALESGVPVLGVCLGHQGLCAQAGARIGLAPEPVHGRTSLVFHNDDELFDGIPSPFEAMRYHSLVAYDVPSELEVAAWTSDGLVMAVRDRARPRWGVQFHPESIATQAGRRLVGNFVKLARKHSDSSTPSGISGAQVSRASAPEPTSAASNRYRRVFREVTPGLDAAAVFDELFAASDRSFWLDTALHVPGLSRFSMMGAADGPLGEVVTYDAGTGEVSVASNGTVGTSSIRPDGGIFNYLQQQLAERMIDGSGAWDGPDLGYVGYLGYEASAAAGGARSRHRSPHPDACMLFADRGVLFDHETGRVLLLALTTADDLSNLAWMGEAARRIGSVEPLPLPGLAEYSSRPEAVPRHSDQDYLTLIAACQHRIRRGESYEVCLTNTFSVDCRIDPWPAYQRLRSVNPAPFAAYLRLGPELAVLSSSPERFVRVDRIGRVESKPIKGTSRRGRTKAEDSQSALRLARDEKERAENVMVVDLVRHDLSHTCEVGSVNVPVLCGIESYSTVHQMVSTVRGALRPGANAVSCVQHAFPGGSVTGAPKRRTMEIIEELEGGPRGIYTGAIGYFSLDGAADLSIAIRTMVATRNRVTIGAGGAITALSDPLAELSEVALKAEALLHVLGAGLGAAPTLNDAPDVAPDGRSAARAGRRPPRHPPSLGHPESERAAAN